jgi:hypothetical protein
VLLFDRTTASWKIVVILMVEGAGVGCVFQPTLVAAQAHSRKSDRAVVISVRNFLRALGGALGLALSSAVFSNTLKKQLNSLAVPLPEDFKSAILDSILRVPDLTQLLEVEKEEVLGAYMVASRSVFIIWVPVMGLCLLLCFLIKDRGLKRAEEKDEAVRMSDDRSNGGAFESDIELQAQDIGEIRAKSLPTKNDSIR